MQQGEPGVASNNSKAPPRTISFETFVVVMLGLACAANLLFFVQAYHYLPVTSDNMYPESAGVVTALHSSKGLPLYEDFRQPPYFVTSFPPLWYVGMGVLAKIGNADLDTLTLWGRLVSLVSLFLLVYLGFKWNRRLGVDGRTSALTVLLYLSFPILIPWAVTARPDIPAVLFSFLAVYVASRELGVKGALLAGLIAAVAFLTRHNSVGAPVAIVLWFASRKQWKNAVSFCAVWWGIVGIVIVAMQRATHGLFLLNLGGSKFGSMAATYVRDLYLRILTSPESGFVIALVAFGVFGAILALRREISSQRLLLLYLLATTFFATLGSAAAGAAVNHFLEPVFALAVFAAFGIAELKQEWSENSPWPAFAVVISAVILLPSLDMQRWNAMHNRPDNLRPIAAVLNHGTVFSDIPYLSARSSTPQFLDPASLTYASRVPGMWSSAGLVSQLQKAQFDAVVLSESPEVTYDPKATYPRYPHLGAELRSAIVHNYSFCREWNHALIYVPADPARTNPGLSCNTKPLNNR